LRDAKKGKKMAFYHKGNRNLQDRFDGRRLANSLEKNRKHTEFTEEDRQFVETAPFFFLATTAHNMVDCSFKGGVPGFVKITGPKSIAFPDYDGNSMYKSLGNILENKNVGLLFINFSGAVERMRINGTATIDHNIERIEQFEGAKSVVDITVSAIFPNCPRYIPTISDLQLSEHSPKAGHTPPDPAWKFRDYAKPYLPAADKKRIF
jgi:predicted pyridoxine 5'-phosphate oxidase superfamily flavin-nucleotide-binding protein